MKAITGIQHLDEYTKEENKEQRQARESFVDMTIDVEETMEEE